MNGKAKEKHLPLKKRVIVPRQTQDVIKFKNNESRPLSLFKGDEHIRIPSNGVGEVSVEDMKSYPELSNRFNSFIKNRYITILGGEA